MAETDQEYLEKARETWEKYRFYILSGIVLVLTAVAGFTYQHSHSQETRTDANDLLFALIDSADNGDLAGAENFYADLRNAGYPELGNLAAFTMASLYVGRDKQADAVPILREVADNSGDSGLRELAALRLSEIHLRAGDYEDAIKLLEKSDSDNPRMKVLFQERLGDAHYANGGYPKAVTHYRQAASFAAKEAQYYLPVLNIKLSALRSKEFPAEPESESEEDAAENDETDSNGDAAEKEDTEATNEEKKATTGSNN